MSRDMVPFSAIEKPTFLHLQRPDTSTPPLAANLTTDLKGSVMGQSGTDSRIDNIEFAVSDIARSRAFYDKAFGWTFTDYGPAYCEFSDGRLTGGLAKSTPSPGGPLVILYADDLAATQRRLEDAGAKIVKPVFAFSGGRRFHFQDPDGYELAVWSDK
jgi:uncharacterized protein